jgi:hypothetical protein
VNFELVTGDTGRKYDVEFISKADFSRYIADWVYGHAILYFMCAVIGVFATPHILSRIWRASKRENPLEGNKTWQRGLASTRFLGYKTFYL